MSVSPPGGGSASDLSEWELVDAASIPSAKKEPLVFRYDTERVDAYPTADLPCNQKYLPQFQTVIISSKRPLSVYDIDLTKKDFSVDVQFCSGSDELEFLYTLHPDKTLKDRGDQVLGATLGESVDSAKMRATKVAKEALGHLYTNACSPATRAEVAIGYLRGVPQIAGLPRGVNWTIVGFTTYVAPATYPLALTASLLRFSSAQPLSSENPSNATLETQEK